jgi:NAD-dependent DNA ligase
MDGKQISKCAGHNYGYLIDNKISKGTKVILSLAGDIIPFLYKVTNTDDYSENKINFPSEYITEINGCHLNAILDKKSINKKQFIDSVISLNIPSIGPAGAKKIFEYLESISSDAETLDFFGEEEKELPNNILLISPEEVYYGIGSGKSGTSAKNSFKKILKNITLKDIILSNNFRFCGGKAAEQVEKYLTDQSYDFNHLAGQSYEWAKNSESDNFKQLLKILNYLGKSFDDFKERAKEIASEDENKIPVILTGEPNDYESKSMFLKCHPEYRMTGSWKEVQIVFTNSLESNTGKMKKAREKNIEIRLY